MQRFRLERWLLTLFLVSTVIQLGSQSVCAAERKVRVLYVEAEPRWEYRFLKNLLERESSKGKNKSEHDLAVHLLNASAEYAKQDPTAIASFPTKKAIAKYDVVILGDVWPTKKIRDASPAEARKRYKQLPGFFKDLSAAVKQGECSLVLIAGSRFDPKPLQETALKNVLPIEPSNATTSQKTAQAFRPRLTAAGKKSSLLSFGTKTDVTNVWLALPKLHSFARGYRAKKGATVLATHPSLRAGKNKELHPLIISAKVGEAQSVLLGIDETWRWRFRDHLPHYEQFWLTLLRQARPQPNDKKKE